MEIQFVYQKKRSEFGRQCVFYDKGPELIDNYPPNRKLLSQWIPQDPVDKSTLCAPVQALHELNTLRADFKNSGMTHIEGGWPKDINMTDEEATKRYKRKIEKEDSYPPALLALCKRMEFNILQNNAINIYQQYFDGMDPLPLIEKSSARIVNVYKDQCTPIRPVNWISWSPDNQTKIAVAHCYTKFQYSVPNLSNNLYIWEIESPTFPLYTLKPSDATLCIEYHQKDHNILVSGQYCGQVAYWDLRKGPGPVAVSVREESFRSAVHNVLWINSKTGTEFFSSSTDGQVKWWDVRNLDVPLDTLMLDLNVKDQHISDALGASVLEYDPTIPTRYMVGTEQGLVISCNRKGKTPAEVIITKYAAHFGPVLSLQRNSSFAKNFLTCGDWSLKIFSEDCKESPIMWTSYHKAAITHSAWSPTRPSVYFSARSDGKLDVWDILQNQKHPNLSMKICDTRLTTIRVHDQGRLIAVGNDLGSVYLVQLTENLATASKTDKALLSAMFERESKREKILEARNRELKLKMKTKSQTVAVEGEQKEEQAGESEEEWTTSEVINAEQEWYAMIDEITRVKVPEEDLEEQEEVLLEAAETQ